VAISNRYCYLLFALAAMVFLCVAFSFSFSQSLWVDETTQLSGIQLSIGQLYSWLSGDQNKLFLVPADRMPVLSYLIGSLWSALFGGNPLIMRWLSLFLVLMAFLLFITYSIRLKYCNAIAVALVFFALSPNLTVISVEIRAYALFFLLSSAAVLLFVDVVRSCREDKPMADKLLCLSLVLMLTINTHFFGVLLTGSLVASYCVLMLVERRFIPEINIIFYAGIAIVLGLAFAYPPFEAAVFMSQGGGVDEVVGFSLKPAVKLIFRLVAHQSLSQFKLLPLMALLVVYGVIIYSLIKSPNLIKVALVLVLVFGFLAAFIANIFVSGFSPLSPSYNIWMLPFLGLLFGICVSELSTIRQVLLMLLAMIPLAFGQYNLVVDGEKYAHTRFNEIERIVRGYGKENVSIVYDKDMAKTWFAGLYKFDAKITQYIQADEGYIDLKTRRDVEQSELEAQSDVIVSVYGRSVYTKELVVSASSAPLASSSKVFGLIRLSEAAWSLEQYASYMAQESADILVYKKRF